MAGVIAFPEREPEPATATIAQVEPAPLAEAAFHGLAGEIVLWEDDGAFHIISLLTITKLSFDKPARAGKAGTAPR